MFFMSKSHRRSDYVQMMVCLYYLYQYLDNSDEIVIFGFSWNVEIG